MYWYLQMLIAKDSFETISVFSYENAQNLDELALFQFGNELSDSLLQGNDTESL